MSKETFEEKLARVTSEKVELAEYNPIWPKLFNEEKEKLLLTFSPDLFGRIEHFGSTSVPGLTAKPIVDMLIEVFSFDEIKKVVVPVLESQGYDYFWRPTFGDAGEPFYHWFIKRNDQGQRTHHLHMVRPDFLEHWERLLFRDYLISHPERALAYADLKGRLMNATQGDRIKYTQAKSDFIVETMKMAKGN